MSEFYQIATAIKQKTQYVESPYEAFTPHALAYICDDSGIEEEEEEDAYDLQGIETCLCGQQLRLEAVFFKECFNCGEMVVGELQVMHCRLCIFLICAACCAN